MGKSDPLYRGAWPTGAKWLRPQIIKSCRALLPHLEPFIDAGPHNRHLPTPPKNTVQYVLYIIGSTGHTRTRSGKSRCHRLRRRRWNKDGSWLAAHPSCQGLGRSPQKPILKALSLQPSCLWSTEIGEFYVY